MKSEINKLTYEGVQLMKNIYDKALLQICYFYDLVLYPRYYRLKRKFRKPLKGKITEEGIRRFNDALNKYGGLNDEAME